MLSLAVWQDMGHTYKSFVYGLAHHQSPGISGRSWVRLPFGEGEGGAGWRALRKFFFRVFRLTNTSTLFKVASIQVYTTQCSTTPQGQYIEKEFTLGVRYTLSYLERSSADVLSECINGGQGENIITPKGQ